MAENRTDARYPVYLDAGEQSQPPEMEIDMEYSGNINKDIEDKDREDQAKIDAKNEFVCRICHKKASEDFWHFGYECCMGCFSDHLEEISYKHREERNKEE